MVEAQVNTAAMCLHTTFEGTWKFTGGTGMFSGASGSGTYSGRITAEGLTYEWEGDYELK